jgi:uncharacterized protein
MGGHVGLIVKATRHCNLRCGYCNDWRTGPDQTMPFAVMARMVAAALSDSAHQRVSFFWHGGETLVLPRPFYEKALYVQARFRRPGQRIDNALQTNATLIDAAWARFFRTHDLRVSVSLDGPPALHDQQRVYASGRPSLRDVLRGIAVLREHDVPFSALLVVDERALAIGADAIFDFFLDHGITRYGLLAAAPANRPNAARGTPTAHYVDPAAMTAFLMRMYDRWADHGDPRIRIREIEAVRSRLAQEGAGVCTLAGSCLGHYFAVEPNGDVAHCDLFVGDARYTLGNLLHHDFVAFRARAELRTLEEENERELDPMRACPEFSVCNGWCPHERYLSVRHNPHHEAACCGLRALIAHVRGRELDRARSRQLAAHP